MEHALGAPHSHDPDGPTPSQDVSLLFFTACPGDGGQGIVIA